jgi:hypothetical protein
VIAVLAGAPNASAVQAAQHELTKVMINLQMPADLLARVDGRLPNFFSLGQGSSSSY